MEAIFEIRNLKLIDIPLNFILTHENIKKMINLNVIKIAMFLPVKNQKSSLSNSAP